METLDELKQGAKVRRRESVDMARAYSATLSALVPANFILVVGAALLSLVAGATILVETHLVSKITSGVLALVSSAFTIIHSRLGCEQYQAECKKLVSFYRGMAEDYGNLQFVADAEEFRKRFFALNDQLSAAAKSASAWPFDWASAKAKKNAA